MVSRLVLGCGWLGHALVDALASREGRLRVLDADPDRVQALRDESVPADRADVTDPVAIADRDPVDVVVVAGDHADRNAAAAAAAREAYPGAYLLAYAGVEPDADARASLETLADRVVDPGSALLDLLDEHTADGALERARGLREALRSVEGRLGVFTHDNPDPDAIASAVALVRIAASLGVDAEACYYGEISHQENRALVNLLGLDLRRFEDGESPDHDALALVDHARPGVNDQLPPDADVRIVVDHHPVADPPVADDPPVVAFTDRRDEVGATSTLLTEYVRQFGVDLGDVVATGLFYGIRVDTADFTREVTVADFEAAADLFPHVDRDVLERVESPSLTGETFDTLARAVRNRVVRGTALVSCVGSIPDRDALSQAADSLLAMEGVTVTLVCGFADGTVYVSARARGTDTDLGATLRAAFGELGSAGGHQDMAGAQIPLGVFDAVEDDPAALASMVDTAVTERFFAALAGEAESLPPTVAAADSDPDAAPDPDDDGSSPASRPGDS